jgi:hypothetical protein
MVRDGGVLIFFTCLKLLDAGFAFRFSLFALLRASPERNAMYALTLEEALGTVGYVDDRLERASLRLTSFRTVSRFHWCQMMSEIRHWR